MPAPTMYFGGMRASTAPLRSSLLVLGVGGLGNALLERCARLPLRRLTLVDGDRVEPHNLERQPLFAPVDVGRPKVAVAAAWLRQAMPGTVIEVVDAFADATSLPVLVKEHSIVADCTDDVHVRTLIDQACGNLCIPLVSGAVHQHEGQVLLLHAPDGPGDPSITREHVFGGRPGPGQDECDMRSVPLDVLEAVGARMQQRAGDLMAGRPVENGVLELYAGGRWSRYAPPAIS